MLWLALPALLWLSGCTGPPEGPYWGVSSRFIEGEPTELFSIAQLRRKHRDALYVDFSQEASKEAWEIADRKVTAQGLSLNGGGHLEGAVQLQAVEVEEVEVVFRTQRRGAFPVSLHWSSGGAPFKAQRSLRMQSNGAPGERTVRLAVQKHPRWQGRIDRLRLNIEGTGEILLQEMRMPSARLVSERLPEYLGRPWRVDLGDDVRSGLLAVPGLEITQRVRVPENASFRVDYGHLSSSAEAIKFQIHIDDGSGEVTLFSKELKAAEAPTTSWREARVDLAEWSGREIELTLETASEDAGEKPLYGVPVWANPEVLAPQAEKPWNVILISLDTLRADRMSLYGYERPTTPRLGSWAEEHAVVFENALAMAPWTLPSHTSMLTGISTLRHGVNHARPLPERLELLSEILRGEGYRTMAITGGGYVHPSFRLDQGFDRFRYWSGFDPQTGKRQQLNQELEILLADAGQWLETHADERFFMFFHTYDIHHRVLPREPYYSTFSDVEAHPDLRIGDTEWDPGFKKRRSFVLGRGKEERPLPEELSSLPGDIYDSRIAYLDEHLAGLFEQLESLGLSDHTLVVLTSDHGEMLGEHDLYDHHYLYDQNLKVPLLVSVPWAARKSSRIETQVRSIDIVPSILDFLGLSPQAEADGESLRRLMTDGSDGIRRPAWSYAARSNRGLSLRLDNRVKVVFDNTAWTPGYGEARLYDLEQDPQEAAPKQEMGDYESLRRALVEKYAQEVPALHMKFQNPTATEFAVSIGGSVTRTFMATKSVDLDCDCVQWLEKSAEVRVPPGAEFSLIFEDFIRGGKAVELTPQGGEPWHLDDADLDAPMEISWTPGEGWQREHAGPAPTVGIRWSGAPQEGGGEAPEESDDKLRSQLEALGYL